jgi:hypothetical protein
MARFTRSLPISRAICLLIPHAGSILELGGGALLDLGIYPDSFAWDIPGKPEEIMAMARFKDTVADAEVATVFRHTGGRHLEREGGSLPDRAMPDMHRRPDSEGDGWVAQFRENAGQRLWLPGSSCSAAYWQPSPP